jgi:hypothetical protein
MTGMKRSLLFKVVALAGALLLGSAYVYDRAGGNLLPAFHYGPTTETAPVEGSATAAPETFYGSKSAPVFQALPAEAVDATLMPGSKSAAVFLWNGSDQPSTYEAGTPQSDVVETANDEPPPRLLPGSKSAGLFTPSSPPPPPPPRAKAQVRQRQERQQQALPPKSSYRVAPRSKANTSPPSDKRGSSNVANDVGPSVVVGLQPDRLLPGSKSDLMFTPRQSPAPPTPPTPPKANRARQPAPPAQKSTSRRLLPGSKSRAVFEPREVDNANQANERPRRQSANLP